MIIDFIPNNISRIQVTSDMELALKLVKEYVKDSYPTADNFSYDHIGQQCSQKIMIDNEDIKIIYYNIN